MGQVRDKHSEIELETRRLGVRLAGVTAVIFLVLVLVIVIVPSLLAPLSAFLVFFGALLIWLVYSLLREAQGRAAGKPAEPAGGEPADPAALPPDLPY